MKIRELVPATLFIALAATVAKAADFETLRATMSNLDAKDMPGTHAGPDGAIYKVQFTAEVIVFIEDRGAR